MGTGENGTRGRAARVFHAGINTRGQGRFPLAPSKALRALSPLRRAWYWYTKQAPAWLPFVVPLLLMFAPFVLALVELPQAAGAIASISGTVIFALDVAIVTGLAFNLEWWVVLATVIWMEGLFTVWLVSNLELIRRWRSADRFFVRRERHAETVYRRRAWIRRFHFWGVVVFTFLPLSSGVIVSTFLAKFTGMGDRRTVAAVMLGTATWAAFLTWVFAASIGEIRVWLEKVTGVP